MLAYVALALALLALAMGSLALYRTNKRAEGFSGSAPALVDMKEFAGLHADLKTAYRGAVVDKILPAATKIANAAWADLDDVTRQRVLSVIDKAATETVERMDRDVSPQTVSRAIRTFGEALQGAVAATTKPTFKPAYKPGAKPPAKPPAKPAAQPATQPTAKPLK